MRNQIASWLQAEPIPPELKGRVLLDPRLAATPDRTLRSRVAFATAALVVLVVGVGLGSVLVRGTHPSGVVGALPSARVSPGASPSATATVPAIVPGPIPTGPAAVRACRTADLAISIGRANGAAGTIFAPFNVTNRGAGTCTLQGYFGLALLNSSGLPIGTAPTRDRGGFGASPQVGPVVLVPGAGARFYFHWSDVQSTSLACPAATRVELTAPNQYDHAFVPARTGDGMSIAPCSPGGTGLTEVSALG
mgnify:CR=1 FL=1